MRRPPDWAGTSCVSPIAQSRCRRRTRRIRSAGVARPITYSGGLLAESLADDAVLDGVPLTVTKVFRAAIGDTTAGQPRDWTFIEFSVPASLVDTFAESLSRALRAQGG